DVLRRSRSFPTRRSSDLTPTGDPHRKRQASARPVPAQSARNRTTSRRIREQDDQPSDQIGGQGTAGQVGLGSANRRVARIASSRDRKSTRLNSSHVKISY